MIRFRAGEKEVSFSKASKPTLDFLQPRFTCVFFLCDKAIGECSYLFISV